MLYRFFRAQVHVAVPPRSMIEGPSLGARRALFAIFLGSLVVRAVAASTLHNPGYLDAFGYFHVAENLANGRGLTEDFVFSYVDASPLARALPHPSHLYWMPLTSVVAWLGMRAFSWLFSPFAASQAPFVVLGALLPPLAAALAFRLHRSRALAAQAALIALFVPSYFDRFCVSEPMAPFAVAATGLLLLVARPRVSLASVTLAGLCAGAAHLTRADGVLLVAVGAVVLARASSSARANAARVGLFLGAYAVVMAPWWVRQILVAGTPFPGAGAKTALFRSYDDMFAFEAVVSLSRLFEGGVAPVLAGRGAALVANATELTSVFQVVLLPMAVYAYATLARDRQRVVRPAALYAVALVAFMTLVTPYPAQFGSLYRSSAALVPFVAALAPAGAAAAARRYARWRGHDPLGAARVFGWAFALSFIALAGVYHARELGLLASDAEPWNTRLDAYRAIGTYLDADRRAPGGSRAVLTTNPPAFTLATGRPSAMTPTDGPSATLHAADRVGARYLVLESNLTWAFPLWQSRGVLPGYRFVRDFADGSGAPARLYERTSE